MVTHSGVACRISCGEEHEAKRKYFLGDKQKYYEIPAINSHYRDYRPVGAYIFYGWVGNHHIECNVRDLESVRL